MFTSGFTGAQVDALLSKSNPKSLTDALTFTPGVFYCASSTACNNLPHKESLPSGLSGGFVLINFEIVSGRTFSILMYNEGCRTFFGKSNAARTTWAEWWEIPEVSNTTSANTTTKRADITAERPTTTNYEIFDRQAFYGTFYFDTTLGKPIFYVGTLKDANDNLISATGWVDATGASV